MLSFQAPLQAVSPSTSAASSTDQWSTDIALVCEGLTFVQVPTGLAECSHPIIAYEWDRIDTASLEYNHYVINAIEDRVNQCVLLQAEDPLVNIANLPSERNVVTAVGYNSTNFVKL